MTWWQMYKRRHIVLLLTMGGAMLVQAVLRAQSPALPPMNGDWTDWFRNNAVALAIAVYHIGVTFTEFKNLKSRVSDLEDDRKLDSARYVQVGVLHEIKESIGQRFDGIERMIARPH